jgi:aryl-alcohol dehydrogenase-like predicted oxidoreductase
MRYKLLGRSGLRVSELSLGTMTFGEDWGWGASKSESKKIFDAYAEAGGNFIDTACNYTEGTSEKFVGEFVASDRDYFVIATKYTLRPQEANDMDPNFGGNNRKNLMRSVEASLKRLNTDFIDLLYLHMWDYTTSVEEVMRGLDDLVKDGKVHYLGFSDTPAYLVTKANMLADLQSLSPIVAVQVPYNLVRRDPERELFPMTKEEDIGVTVWGLLGGGVLTGKYRQADVDKRYEDVSEERLLVADKVVEIAGTIGRTPSQVAINWVRQQKEKAQILPILGARTLNQIEDNLGVLEFELTPDQLQEIGELSDFQVDFPWSFLHDEYVLELIHGKTYPKLDFHR